MKRHAPTFTVYRRKYRAPDGTKHRTRTWYVRFSIAGRKYRRSLKTRDRRAAELLAAEMVKREEMRRAGAVDPFEEQRVRPLSEHVADFETWLNSRGVSEAHVNDRMGCLRAYVEAAGPRDLPGLEPVRASEWLGEAKASGLAARTVNRRYEALRQFGRFLLRTRRMAFDPFESLSPLNAAEDRRHVRRALTPDEAERLIQAARTRPLEAAQAARTLKGVSRAEEVRLRAQGEARVLLYAVALGTGLRRGELTRLRWADVDLDDGAVTVRAESAKSRREQSVPLRADLVTALREQRGTSEAMDLVFPPATFPTLRTFKRDLAAAGIIRREMVEVPSGSGKRRRRREVFHTEDENGRVVDFHSLRLTFVTGLSLAGVHPRIAQALARHSTIDLTMQVYTDPMLLDLRGGVEALAVVPQVVPQPAQKRAVGCATLPRSTSAATDAETAEKPAPTGRDRKKQRRREVVSPAGLEPAASGLGRRWTDTAAKAMFLGLEWIAGTTGYRFGYREDARWCASPPASRS